MASVLLYLFSMLRVAGGRRLLPRAGRDPLSCLQQQPIEQSLRQHTSHHDAIMLACTCTRLLNFASVHSHENFLRNTQISKRCTKDAVEM